MLTQADMRRLVVVLGLLVIIGCGGPRAIRYPGGPTTLPVATRADKRAAFARGYTAFQNGDRDLALAIFSVLATTYPELADYHLYYIGVLQERRRDPAAAETAFRRLLFEYGPSVKAVPAALELGTLLVHADRIGEARPFLQRALAAPDTGSVQRARLALAEADERSGDIAAAYDGFMSLRRDAPRSAVDRTAKEHVLALRARHPALLPAGAARLEEARLLLAEHDYAAAQSAAAEILDRLEGVDPADAVRVQADALYGEGKVEAALSALWRITDRYPDSPAAPEAWFRMATILWNRDRDAVALQAYEQLRRLYPYGPHTAEALYASGRIHEKAGDADAAMQIYGELVRRFPGTRLSAEAAWRIGWIHYLAHDWSAADATFARLAERTTERDAAAYWQARALGHAGRSATAQAVYRTILQRDPNGYYAMWAQRRLRGDLDSPLLTPTSVVAPEPPQPGQAPFTDPFHLPRWEELRATGVVTLAHGELAAIEREHPDDGAVLQYLFRAYRTIDAYAASVRLLRRAGSVVALPESERRRFAYPLAFWGTVERESQSAVVAPLLVEAVMRQESLFDPQARSPADARGLMQLLPGTAARVATANGMHVDVAELTEPDINIALGVRYLRDLLGRFSGDPLKAVAAYNGGETAVERWQRRFGDLQPDEFVESITYRETRDYVKRVMANYRQYVQLYGVAQ
jgi:soluble lytic murein transglycosylase